MILGYSRVSTGEQDAALQVEALKAAGVERLFKDKASGGRWDRPELHRMLETARKGDVLMVWKLDRLSRSLRDLITLLALLEEKGIGFRSLTEAVDTTTAAGRMLAQMLGSFAEFERSMLRERTMAGLKAARKKGRIGGRPPKLSEDQRNAALKMLKEGKSQADVSRLFNVAASTICRFTNQHAPAKVDMETRDARFGRRLPR